MAANPVVPLVPSPSEQSRPRERAGHAARGPLARFAASLALAVFLAGCTGVPATSDFPDDYLVGRLELPDGLNLSPEATGWPSNPYHVPHGVRDQCSPRELCGYSPDDQWTEAISKDGRREPVASIDAAYWKSTDEVSRTVDLFWAPESRQDCGIKAGDADDSHTALFRDKNVIVVLHGIEPELTQIMDLVRAKATSLEYVCSR